MDQDKKTEKKEDYNKSKNNFQNQLIRNIEVNITKCKEKHQENLRKEAEEVDPRLMFLKLKKAFIEQYGRINASDTKANDALAIANEFKSRLNKLEQDIEVISYSTSAGLGDLQKKFHQLCLQTRPWYIKLGRKIKCLLKLK